MSVPLNKQDYERFTKLAEAIMEHGEGEISIYTGDGYVSIEMKTKNLPLPTLNGIFGVNKQARVPFLQQGQELGQAQEIGEVEA